MSYEYSTYDAKARLSEILRKVREGRVVTITYHGKPIAEVRPLRSAGEDLSDHLRRLEGQGALVRSAVSRGSLRPLVRRPGALRRFLHEREG